MSTGPVDRVGAEDVARLEAEARYARERYHLYRAKSYGPRPTNRTRLRELEHRSELAGRRVVAARHEAKVRMIEGPRRTADASVR